MTTIREATEADTPQILAMGEQFYATTHYRNFAPYDPPSVEHIIGLMRDGVLLVAEQDGRLVGMVGLVIFPHLFNHNYKVANEVCWWVEPSIRGGTLAYRMMQAIEPAARAKGATAIQMAELSTSPPAASAIYRRLGYTHTESAHLKRL